MFPVCFTQGFARAVAFSVVVTMVSLTALAEDPLRNRMNATLENNNLYIEVILLSTPTIGFDGLPESSELQDKIRDLLLKFERHSMIFQLPDAAKCFLINSYTDYLSNKNDSYRTRNEAEEIIRKAADADATTDGDAVVPSAEPAFEFYMIYEFRCRHPEKLSVIPITLFDHFKKIKTILFYGLIQGRKIESTLMPGDRARLYD